MSTPRALRTEHLAAPAAAALAWLARNAERFRPPTDSKHALPWRVKALAELAFVLTTLRRRGVEDPSLAVLTECARDAIVTVEWRELAAYDASAVVMLALVADFCLTHDHEPPWDGAYFDRLVDSGYVAGSERLPYREMDLAYWYERIGRGDFSARIAAWWGDTACGLRQPAAVSSIEDVYSLTHAIFYLTDIGRRSPDAVLSAEDARHLRHDLVTHTAIALRACNADILGELILCWRFAGIELDDLNQSIAAAALDRLIAMQLPGGEMPAPSFDHSVAAGDPLRFAYNYHPTLVAALAFHTWAQQR